MSKNTICSKKDDLVSQVKLHRYYIAKWIIVISLMITPAILNVLYIKEFGVNVTFWDQWEVVPLFDKLYSGQLSFTDLFAQHNEHRLFFPRVIMLLLGITTDYNNIAEMYFSWFLLCLISFVLLKVYIRYFGRTQEALVKFIPVVWLIFSLRQWENLLWGFQIAWFMVVLFLLLSLYLLETSRSVGWRFALSIVCGVVCSFSSAQGLLIWPIGLIQILWTWWTQGKESKRLYPKIVSIWCLIGILVYIGYFIGYTHPPHHPSLLYFLHSPFFSVICLIVYIGSPLAVDLGSGAGMGVLLLALYIFIIVYIIKSKLIAPPIMPLSLSLILCTLVMAVLLFLARAEGGAYHALSSRYTTLTILGVVGLYLLILPLRFRYDNFKPFILGFVISLIAFGIIASSGRAIIGDGQLIRNDRQQAAYYLVNLEIQNDENLKKLYPRPQVVRERVGILQKYHLNVFSQPRFTTEQLTLNEDATLFFVEAVNNYPPPQQGYQIVVDTQLDEMVTISGWAVDQNAGQAAGGVFVNLDGQIDIPAFYGLDRRDVADHFQNSRYRFSGFSASFTTSMLSEGQHILLIRVVSADGKSYYESDQEIVLEIR